MAIEGKVTLEGVTVEWANHAQGVTLKVGELFVVVDEVGVPGNPRLPAKHWSGVLTAKLVFDMLVPAMNYDGEVPAAADCWKAVDMFEAITGIRVGP